MASADSRIQDKVKDPDFKRGKTFWTKISIFSAELTTGIYSIFRGLILIRWVFYEYTN